MCGRHHLATNRPATGAMPWIRMKQTSMTTPELPRLTVIGTGYLGATHAICMASLGYEVLGVDVDVHKIRRLAEGEVPFFEPVLPELLTKALESGRLRFGTSFEE